jgi:hypothetical protein
MRNARCRIANVFDAAVEGTRDVSTNGGVVDLQERRRNERCGDREGDDPARGE